MDPYFPRKRSLLQDVFGKSAFDDFTHPTVSAEACAFFPREGKEGITSLFDTAAFLMPPLELSLILRVVDEREVDDLQALRAERYERSPCLQPS